MRASAIVGDIVPTGKATGGVVQHGREDAAAMGENVCDVIPYDGIAERAAAARDCPVQLAISRPALVPVPQGSNPPPPQQTPPRPGAKSKLEP